MEWTDQGIVLGARRHGETNAILELMTCEHGRHLGLIRGGTGSRLRPVLQPGNSVHVVWRARLDEHLGNYTVEPSRSRAAGFLSAAHAVYGVTHLAALCRLLPERDPHPAMHDLLESILDHMDDSKAVAARVAQFELRLLAELGFGLDLESCAVTGRQSDLVYVSPKSGRAVSREAGAPWHDRLLALPAFLTTDEIGDPPAEQIAAGFALTGFFFLRHVLEPRGLAFGDARERLIATVLRPRSNLGAAVGS